MELDRMIEDTIADDLDDVIEVLDDMGDEEYPIVDDDFDDSDPHNYTGMRYAPTPLLIHSPSTIHSIPSRNSCFSKVCSNT